MNGMFFVAAGGKQKRLLSVEKTYPRLSKNAFKTPVSMNVLSFGPKLFCIVLLGIAPSLQPLWGQSAKPSVRVQVSRDSIGLDGTVRMQVEVLNARPRDFQLPELPGLSVQAGPNVAAQTTIVNGRTSSSTSYTYLLKPTELGTHRIPPLVVRTDQGELVSEPLEVAVVPDELVPFEPKRPAPQRRGWPFYNEPPKKKYGGRSHRL